MKKEINVKDLVTFARYAEMKSSIAYPLSRQRVIQLVNEGRLESTEIDGKKFVSKFAEIKPSKKKKPGPKPDNSLKVIHNGKLVYKSQIKL